MPGDTPMSYPFPYKTSDGLLVDNSTGPVVIPEIKTDEIIITQGYTDAYSISTSTGPPRGLIRTLDEAFGFDIDVQGTGKLIRLMTDDIVRTTVEDTKVTISNALDVLGQVKGITIEGTQLISTIATGTTPLLVTSTTVVPNLNVSQLLGNTWTIPGTIGSTTANTGTFTTLTATTLRGSTTTANANDTLLFGISTFDNCFIDRNFAGGNFIWGWNTGKITTEHFIQQWYNNSVDRNLLMSIVSKGSVSGTDRIQITCPLVSTLVTGTAPFTIASTTVVPNLNVSQLLGGTWAIPGTIGSTTPNTGNFTVTTTTSIRGTGTSFIANDTLMIGLTTFDNCFIDRNFAGGNFIWGWNTPKVAGEHAIQQFFNNATDRQALLSIVSKGTSSGTDRVSITCPLNLSNTLNILGNNTITMIGGSSGSVNIKPNTTGSNWDFVLPDNPGSSGQVLTSGAGSTCTWTTISSIIPIVNTNWTPGLTILSGPNFGGSYTTSTSGRYYKIGSVVTINFEVTIYYSFTATLTSFKLTNVPFAADTAGQMIFPVYWSHTTPNGFRDSGGSNVVTPQWYLTGTDLRFVYFNDASSYSDAFYSTNGTVGSLTVSGGVTYMAN